MVPRPMAQSSSKRRQTLADVLCNNRRGIIASGLRPIAHLSSEKTAKCGSGLCGDGEHIDHSIDRATAKTPLRMHDRMRWRSLCQLWAYQQLPSKSLCAYTIQEATTQSMALPSSSRWYHHASTSSVHGMSDKTGDECHKRVHRARWRECARMVAARSHHVIRACSGLGEHNAKSLDFGRRLP